MRTVLAPISIVVLLASGAAAQSGAGIDPWTAREMAAVSEMGHTHNGPEGPPLLTFEKDDDPTVNPHPVPLHEPSRAVAKLADQAEHLARKKQRDEAIAKYREVLALDPQYFQAWNNLALQLKAAGKTDEAEQILRRLMQSNPEHVVVFANLGSLLTGEKRYADAETVARLAMKQHSYSFAANYLLGTALVNEGKFTDEAKTKLQYAELKYPEAKKLLEHWPAAAVHN
jgi:tetratricopeptide (TPR) repeat protein